MNNYRDEAHDKDWEAISELLHKTDCVPDAPDCRSAVMARIAKPKPVRRFVWAYATGFAALLVAAIGFAPFLINTGEIDRIATSPKIKHLSSAPEKAAKAPLWAYKSQPAPTPLEQPRVRHIKAPRPVLMAKAGPEPRSVVSLGDRVLTGAERTSAPPALDTAKDKSREVYLNYSGADSSAKAARENPGSIAAGYKLAMPASKPADRSPDLSSADANYYAAAPHAVPTRPAKRSLDSFAAASPAPPAAQPDVTAAGRHQAYGGTLASAAKGRARDALAMMNDAAESSRPIAVAIVTWPSANNRSDDSYSYGYRDRNEATGQTTECRVRRSGNSVEIYMESKPEVQQPPVKGSIEHETKPSA